MRIAVVGVGKIGSAFAFQLARTGGHDVTVVARPDSTRLEQLRRDNGIIDIKGERAQVRVSEALDEQPYDLVIVTLLASQVGAVMQSLIDSNAKSILFMFVNFEPERLLEAIGAERCSFGMPFLQAMLERNGRLKATIGVIGQKTIVGRQRWVDVFNAAGLPAKLEPDMLLWLRCHVPLTVAFESVSVAAVRRGGGASWREAMLLARGVHECFALIRGLGYKIYPGGKARIDRSPPWLFAGVLWFMSRIASFRELLATGENECSALVDVMLAAEDRSKVSICTQKIRAMKPL